MSIDFKKLMESIKDGSAKEFFDSIKEKDQIPKGWVSIEDHLPMWLAKDFTDGFSVYTVKSKDGEVFRSSVSDHNTWYYYAKEVGVTHWLNE